MSEVACVVARCEWCGRKRCFVGDRPARVFCRSTQCAVARELLDLVLDEERSPAPRPEFSARVWDELEALTSLMPWGPCVVSENDQLVMGVAA